MENSKKMGVALAVNTTGAILAYLIGAGFASGQEIMQYFSNWGSIAGVFEIGIIFIVFLTMTYISVGYIGRTREASNVNELYEVIGGKYIGKLLSFFVWAYNLGCYFFMISGFGNTLNQQFGLPVAAGSAIAVVISVGTALLGLRKMVDIIGKIGPVVVGFSLILGIVSAFRTFPHLAEGVALMQSGAVEVNRAGHSILLSGISYTGTYILLPMAYVAHLGHDLRDFRYQDTKRIFTAGTVLYTGCCIILALNYIGMIEECATAAIPNLVLANQFVSGMAIVFSIVIMLSIYSTMCPILWTCASTIWSDEKSVPYRLFIVICGVAVYFITLFVPYETLINYIMTYFGYAGAISGAITIVRFFMLWSQDRKTARAA